jgi:hypothetical protein
MGGLERRLERLERKNPKHARVSEEAEKQMWLATARARRNHENRDRDEFHAHDIFRVLYRQGRRATTTERVREQLLSWRPPPSERAVERVLARAIYEHEEGTESMACPPQWLESLIAADELRERHAAVPEEVVARWAVAQHETEQGGSHDLGEQITAEGESYAITDELISKAIGPDFEELADEEVLRRFRGIVAEAYYGERGYRIQKHIERLMNEKEGTRQWRGAVS